MVKDSYKGLMISPGFEPGACKEKQSREPQMTCPGFEPGACIYLAALTTESSQLLKSRQEMVKDSHKGLTSSGFEPGHALT